MTELDPSILEALRRYDTPTMSNAIETFGVKPWDQGFASWEIRSMFPDFEPMVGYAATVTIRARGEGGPGNQEVMYEHVQRIPSPRVVVVQDLDDPPGCGALWGEVQSTVLKGLGALGTVTNGCVRDLKEVRQIGFQFFAAGVGVSHAYVRVIDTGIEVKIGGLTVQPGDLIHADQHGVLLIPIEIAAQLPAAADRIIEREQALISWVRSPEFDPSELAARRKVQH